MDTVIRNQYITAGRRVALTALLAVTLIVLAVLATSFSGTEQARGDAPSGQAVAQAAAAPLP